MREARGLFDGAEAFRGREAPQRDTGDTIFLASDSAR